jgi:acyl carrier protein
VNGNGHANGNGHGHAAVNGSVAHAQANGHSHHSHSEHANGKAPVNGTASVPQARPPAPMAPEEIERLAERIEAWLLDWLVRRAEVAPSELDRDKPLADFGIDSLAAVELSQELEAWLGVELTPVLAWNHPTAASLARYLAGEAAKPSSGGESQSAEPVADDDEFARLLAEIEGLSDNEAETKLR